MRGKQSATRRSHREGVDEMCARRRPETEPWTTLALPSQTAEEMQRWPRTETTSDHGVLEVEEGQQR